MHNPAFRYSLFLPIIMRFTSVGAEIDSAHPHHMVVGLPESALFKALSGFLFLHDGNRWCIQKSFFEQDLT